MKGAVVDRTAAVPSHVFRFALYSAVVDIIGPLMM
jgi:hypothetical protein